MAGAEFVAGDEHFIAGAKAGRSAFDDRAGAIDARHVRKRAHDARMSLAGKRVLVIERRIGDANQHVAGGQLVVRDRLDAGRDLAIRASADEVARKRLGLRNAKYHANDSEI